MSVALTPTIKGPASASPTMSTGFSYQSLTAPDAIRLLLLQPRASSPEDEIHCKLQHTTISECDEDLTLHYTALSYVWGSEEGKRMIFVDGVEFHVTVNLLRALRSLCHESKELPFWVDAVCIDQNNLEERGQQVGIMGAIYASAWKTIIYLGESDSESSRAIRALNNLNTAAEFPGGPIDTKGIKNCIVSSILSRPWFTRVWVLQELVLSQNPIIQCGHSRVRWGRLPNLLTQIQQHIHKSPSKIQSPPPNPSEAEQLVIDMQEARERIQLGSISKELGSRKQKNLFDLVRWRSGLGAKDPRDIIYAHIGMVNQMNKDQVYLEYRTEAEPQGTVMSKWLGQDITVEYGKPVPEVYNGFARVLIEYSQDLSFAAGIEAAHPQARMPGLASWAPDWTLRTQYAGIDANDNKSVSQDENNPFTFNSDNSVLGLLGSIRTHVVEVTEVIEWHGSSFPQSGDPSFSSHINQSTSKEKKILLYRDIYEHWRKRLGLHILPALAEQKLSDYRAKDDPEAWDEDKIGRVQTALVGGQRPPTSVTDYLVGFTRTPGGNRKVQGRRIALLEDGTSVFVPPYSKKGDALGVINLYHGLVLLRGHDAPNDPSVADSLKSMVKAPPKDAGAGPLRSHRRDVRREVFGASIDLFPVRHYTFVGGCFGDSDDDKIKFADVETSRWDHCIIQLH